MSDKYLWLWFGCCIYGRRIFIVTPVHPIHTDSNSCARLCARAHTHTHTHTHSVYASCSQRSYSSVLFVCMYAHVCVCVCMCDAPLNLCIIRLLHIYMCLFATLLPPCIMLFFVQQIELFSKNLCCKKSLLLQLSLNFLLVDICVACGGISVWKLFSYFF